MRYFFILLVACASASAQVLVVDDTSYFWAQKKDVTYIFPREHQSALPEVDFYFRCFNEKYIKSFGWRLDEQVKLSIASTQNQVANGFATVTPFLMTTHYPSGIGILETFAQNNFMLALSSHETAHLFQLSAKSAPSVWVKKYFGNTTLFLTPFFPLFTFPNAYLPSSMVEGNAVLNESTHGIGGRLFSGEVRAEVLAQMRAGDSKPARFINNEIEFPLSQAYHQGGYFFAFLAEKYGLEKVNHFYLTHSQEVIWPFSLNDSFRRHFGSSYSLLMHQFEEKWADQAQTFQPTEGAEVAKVFTRPRLNSDDESVYFVANPNGRLSNHLYIYSKKAGQLHSQKMALPIGKAFFIEGQYWTNSSQQVDLSHQKYGLYSESLDLKNGTEGEIVTDLKDGHKLSLSATDSYSEPKLLRDGTFLDASVSVALFDNQNRSYYFRQIGDERILYRDKEPLMKFKGFFGVLADISDDGSVYFIANSDNGSSLFRFSNGKVLRVLNSDDVIDARLLNEKEVLVAAIGAKGYRLVRAHLDSKQEQPAVYKYNFDQTPLPPLTHQEAIEPDGEFKTFSNLRFSQANLVLAGNPTADLVFTDPFLWNMLIINQRAAKNGYEGGLTYLNLRHRLGWLFSGQYDGTPIEKKSTFLLAGDYSLYKTTRHNGHFRLGPYYNDENSLGLPRSRRWGLLANLTFDYARRDYPLAFEPYRHWSLSLLHRTDWLTENGQQYSSANSVHASAGGDIGKQTFLNLSGSWAWSNKNTIVVDYLLYPDRLPLHVGELALDGEASEVRQWRAKLSQVFDQSAYAVRFPLSLMRFAPFLLTQDTTVHEKGLKLYPTWRSETLLGSDFDLLLLNQFMVRSMIAFGSVYTNLGVQKEWQSSLTFSKSF